MSSLNVLSHVRENMFVFVMPFFLNAVMTAKIGSNSYNQGVAPLYFQLLCQSPLLQLPMVNLRIPFVGFIYSYVKLFCFLLLVRYTCTQWVLNPRPPPLSHFCGGRSVIRAIISFLFMVLVLFIVWLWLVSRLQRFASSGMSCVCIKGQEVMYIL